MNSRFLADPHQLAIKSQVALDFGDMIQRVFVAPGDEFTVTVLKQE